VQDDPEEIAAWAKIGLDRLLHPEKIKSKRDRLLAEQQRRHSERLARQAEADSLLTDRRCPNCEKPLPDYRRTCKHCGITVTPPSDTSRSMV